MKRIRSRDFDAAFVTSSLVFAAIFWPYLLLLNRTPGQYADTYATVLTRFGIWGGFLVVVALGVWLIGAPVERFLVTRLKVPTPLKASLIYIGVMIPAGLIFALIGYAVAYPEGTLFIAIAGTLGVGAGVAFIARLLFPLFLGAKQLTSGLLVAILLSGTVIPLLPHGDPRGTESQRFFPNRGTDELARAVYLAGETARTEGMRNFSSTKMVKPGARYQLEFGCNNSPVSASKYELRVRDGQGVTIARRVFHCARMAGTSAQSQSISFGLHRTRLHLQLMPWPSSKAQKFALAYVRIKLDQSSIR